MPSFMQTKEWADFKASQGWQSHRIDNIFVLEKNLPLGKSFLYVPEVEWRKVQEIQIFLENVKKLAQKSSTIFFRLEILDEFDQKIVEKLKRFGFIKALEEVQPEWRQVIDISKPEEEILATMKPKGRYNIKIAQKHGIKIEKTSSFAKAPSFVKTTEDKSEDKQNINDFYEIFVETAKRDGFESRPKKYFEKLYEFLAEKNLLEIWLAKYDNKTIAAELAVFHNDVASYLYGASAYNFRQMMAPYLLHWEIIKRAKARGCRFYDLLAIAPEGSENHKYANLTRFKEQFGGRKVHLVGSWDLVFKPRWYKLFKMVEKYRRG